jgi:carbonic anhydrase
MISAISFIIPDIVISDKTQSISPNDASPEQIWNSLVEGNQRFVAGKPMARDIVSQRSSLEKTQNPPVSVLSCSDSRLPSEAIFDQGLGDLFVVRIAGNSAEPMGIGSLEFAVRILGTKVIVVLGHQRCGGVTAACSEETMASSNLEALIEPIKESCRMAKEQHGSEDLIDSAIKIHIRKTVNDLLAQSEILKHAHDAGKLSIIGAYYSLDSGVVTRLR